MKKILSLAIAAVLVFSLCACGQTADQTDNSSSNDTTLSTVPVSEDVSAAEAKSEKFKALEKFDVDIDLNGLNKTMTTAQMTQISNDPESYLGQTIRLTATYQKQQAEDGSRYYNFAFGYDDTGCCAAWYIEFYGDDVPEDMEDFSSISLVGKLDQYDENGRKYLYVDVEHFAV